MKLYIAVLKAPAQNGAHSTTCAYPTREQCAHWGSSDRHHIVEIELPDPESQAHIEWREARETARKHVSHWTPDTRADFMDGWDFARREPPFSDVPSAVPEAT